MKVKADGGGQGDGVRADIRVFGEGTSGETYMTFGTMTSGNSASTNAVERMRIASTGDVTMTEDLTVDGEAGIGMINNTGYNLAVGNSNSLYSIFADGRIFCTTDASADLFASFL